MEWWRKTKVSDEGKPIVQSNNGRKTASVLATTQEVKQQIESVMSQAKQKSPNGSKPKAPPKMKPEPKANKELHPENDDKKDVCCQNSCKGGGSGAIYQDEKVTARKAIISLLFTVCHPIDKVK